MSDDIRRPTSVTPMYDNLCIQFARRELTDERIAAVIERWSR